MKQLYEHINNYTKISDERFQEMIPFFETVQVQKKEMIYTAFQNNLSHYFILDGCVQMYFINEKGKEQIVQFAINNWWITDYLAFQSGRNSEFYVQAVQPSKMLKISYQDQESLLQKFPEMEVYFRKIYQIGYGAAINRMKYIFSYSKEEIYFQFKESFPKFVKDVPQYLVANYLGLSAEYVSKLNNK